MCQFVKAAAYLNFLWLFRKERPSIFIPAFLILSQGERWCTPWKGHQTVTGLTGRQIHIHTHFHTSGQFWSTTIITYRAGLWTLRGSQRKPIKGKHANSTQKRPQLVGGFKPRTFFLCGDRDTHCTTERKQHKAKLLLFWTDLLTSLQNSMRWVLKSWVDI